MRRANTFVLVMLIIAFSSCNGCKQKEESVYQHRIDSLNAVLDSTLQHRVSDSVEISELTVKNSELIKQDSILRSNLNGNSLNLKENNKGYAKTNRFGSAESDHITRYYTSADSLQ